MSESKEIGTILQKWLDHKHEKIKTVQKQYNNNNNNTKNTVTNKKLDQ